MGDLSLHLAEWMPALEQVTQFIFGQFGKSLICAYIYCSILTLGLAWTVLGLCRKTSDVFQFQPLIETDVHNHSKTGGS